MYRIVFDRRGFWKIEFLKWGMFWFPLVEVKTEFVRFSNFHLIRERRCITQFPNLEAAEQYVTKTGLSKLYVRSEDPYYRQHQEIQPQEKGTTDVATSNTEAESQSSNPEAGNP